MYVKHTGKSLSVIQKSMERDNFMSATEAKSFGLVDKIIESRNEILNLKTNNK
jgi:ATP-dependent Clp protease protease subunit